MWYQLVASAVVALVVVSATKDDCFRLGHFKTVHCCKQEIRAKSLSRVEECKPKDHRPHGPKCGATLCEAVKNGFSSDNGTIDKTVLLEIVEADFKDKPEILENVKKTCFDGDFTKYGPPDACDPLKMKHCISNQYLIWGCTEFDDKDRCNSIKDLTAECKTSEKEECLHLGHPGTMHCCKAEPAAKSIGRVEECKPDGPPHHPHHHDEFPPPPPPCDGMICEAKNKGYASEDGTMDKKALLEIIEQDFKDNAELLEGVKKTCFDGDFTKYGPPNGCDLIKMKHCLTNQYLIWGCSEFKDKNGCKSVKDLAEECKN